MRTNRSARVDMSALLSITLSAGMKRARYRLSLLVDAMFILTNGTKMVKFFDDIDTDFDRNASYQGPVYEQHWFKRKIMVL